MSKALDPLLKGSYQDALDASRLMRAYFARGDDLISYVGGVGGVYRDSPGFSAPRDCIPLDSGANSAQWQKLLAFRETRNANAGELARWVDEIVNFLPRRDDDAQSQGSRSPGGTAPNAGPDVLDRSMGTLIPRHDTENGAQPQDDGMLPDVFPDAPLRKAKEF